MNLVLIGYRGTGKSEVARLLGTKLKRVVVCLDEEIAQAAKLGIPDIVKTHGWSWFRDLESAVAKRFSRRDNLIIDTGGGVILREQNVESLRHNGLVVWLKASVDVIVERIENSTDRPPLIEGKTFLDEVKEVLEERVSLYQAAADHEVDTDALSVVETADRIVQILESEYI